MTLLYRLAVLVGKFTFNVLGRLEVRGLENVPPRGRFILASNHLSNADPPVLAVAAPRALNFLAKRDLFAHPVARWVLTALGAHPTSREGGAGGALVWALHLLQRDQVVLVFPEGTRSRARALQRAQPGVAYLAIKSQAPIVPVAVTGTERVPSILRLFFPLARVTVTFGQPFSLPSIEGEVPREVLQGLADGVMERVAALLPPAYRGVYGAGTPER